MLRVPKLAVALAALALVAPAAPAFARGPIQIQQCFVTVPKPMSRLASGTQINYVNRGTEAAQHVTFAVGYRNAASHFVRHVTDDGDFAPGTLIQHHFSLFNDVTYAGKHVALCQATMVRWANGKVWRM